MTYLDWSARFDFGGPRPVSGLRGVCIHTTESAPGATAQDVTNYQIRSRTGSYNVMVDDHTTILQNTADWRVWASGNQGNDILVHLCFVARSAWSRAEWLSHEPMLRRGAKVTADWCRKYGWPARWVNVWNLPGITTHDATRAWGGTSHTDPGPNFPHDVFCQMVQDLLDGNTLQEDELSAADVNHITDFIKGYVGPIGSDVKDTRQQITGGRDAGQYPGWPQINDRTVVDALAEIGEKLGLDGYKAPPKS